MSRQCICNDIVFSRNVVDSKINTVFDEDVDGGHEDAVVWWMCAEGVECRDSVCVVREDCQATNCAAGTLPSRDAMDGGTRCESFVEVDSSRRGIVRELTKEAHPTPREIESNSSSGSIDESELVLRFALAEVSRGPGRSIEEVNTVRTADVFGDPLQLADDGSVDVDAGVFV